MLFTQIRAMDVLKKYDIGFPKTVVINGSSELWKLSFPGPYVIKVDSPDAVHKTDLGLVLVGVEHEEIKDKIVLLEKKISENKVGEHSFLVQEKVKGAEFLVGMKRDSTFGPVIVFGMGGILVEVIKDVSMRIAPLSIADCEEMLSEVRYSTLLDGYRSYPKVDRKKMIELLMKVSRLAVKEKNISEIDFNPVFVNESGPVVVDARFIGE